MGPSFAVQLLREADELGMQVCVARTGEGGDAALHLQLCCDVLWCIVACLEGGFQQSFGVQQARHSLACI